MQKFPYGYLIGCLPFSSKTSSIDINFAVNIMSKFYNGFTCKHCLIVVDIINYTFVTKNIKINVSNVESFSLCSYSDANLGCHQAVVL